MPQLDELECRSSKSADEGRNKKRSSTQQSGGILHAPTPFLQFLSLRILHYQSVKFSPRYFITRTFDRDTSAEPKRSELLFSMHTKRQIPSLEFCCRRQKFATVVTEAKHKLQQRFSWSLTRN